MTSTSTWCAVESPRRNPFAPSPFRHPASGSPDVDSPCRRARCSTSGPAPRPMPRNEVRIGSPSTSVSACWSISAATSAVPEHLRATDGGSACVTGPAHPTDGACPCQSGLRHLVHSRADLAAWRTDRAPHHRSPHRHTGANPVGAGHMYGRGHRPRQRCLDAAVIAADDAPEWLTRRRIPALLVDHDGHEYRVAGWPPETSTGEAI